MKFPGRRKTKHYFPIDDANNQSSLKSQKQFKRRHLIGIDQTMVDIEAKVSDDFLRKFDLIKGSSFIIDNQKALKLHNELISENLIEYEHPGGTIANTLHNYSMLADDKSVLLGVMSKKINVGSFAYKYLCHSSSRMDLNYLDAVDGPIGRCYTLISSDGERTFAINKGSMNELSPKAIDESIFQDSCALVISAYITRCESYEEIQKASEKAIAIAKNYKIPVVLSTGTKFLIQDRPEWWLNFIKENIDILAMNEEESMALTGCENVIESMNQLLDITDYILCTVGSEGIYTAGYTDDDAKRSTTLPLISNFKEKFNEYEFSRAMMKSDCIQPLKVFSYKAPFKGGPEKIKNTNGAGDGALAALLHDISANQFHRDNYPNSEKHNFNFLTYSSFSQVCKYANRVSYEVISQHSPRLMRGLPEKEDCLEEAYWDN